MSGIRLAAQARPYLAIIEVAPGSVELEVGVLHSERLV
jgi:hypothetical protein